MNFLYLGYILVPVALVMMMKFYKTSGWVWLTLLIVSVFLGVAQFVAAAYLVTFAVSKRGHSSVPGETNYRATGITYQPNGSYTVYTPANIQKAPSTAITAFRIIGGIVAGLAIAFGLLIVGLFIMIVTFKARHPGSKVM